MAREDLETRVEKLEAKTKKLKDSLEHSTDILEIMNMQSLYNQLLSSPGFSSDRIWDECFAHKDERVRDEMVETGVYEGIEAVKRMIGGGPRPMRTLLPHVYSMPIYVVVSKDGKTAKGMCDMWGPHAMVNTPYPGNVRKMVQYWFFGKYNNVFIKEDGRWKFLSRHVIYYFRTPYDQGWLKQPDCRRLPVGKNAKPPSVISLLAPYHSDGVFYPIPAPPEPEE